PSHAAAPCGPHCEARTCAADSFGRIRGVADSTVEPFGYAEAEALRLPLRQPLRLGRHPFELPVAARAQCAAPVAGNRNVKIEQWRSFTDLVADKVEGVAEKPLHADVAGALRKDIDGHR